MNEFLEQFVLETRDLVETALVELSALGQAPTDKDRLDGAFRALHTLKGCAGIVDFDAMSRVMHVAEQRLAAAREGKTRAGPDLIAHCVSALDLITRWADEIDATGALPAAPDLAADALVSRFEENAKPGAQAAKPVATAEAGDMPSLARRILEEQSLLIGDPHPSGRQGRIVSAARVAGQVMRFLGREAEAEAAEAAEKAFVASADAKPVAALIANWLAKPEPLAPARRSPGETRYLRVDADRIESLVSVTGELMASSNAIAFLARAAEDAGNPLAAALKRERTRLERLVQQLRQTALTLRVVPLRGVFQRFQRVVRELGVELGKPAALVVEGEGTEVDKAVADVLFEPLLHLVRNAMDHGVEAPEPRAAAGKPAVARLALKARRKGSNVIVEVEDDGGGIDLVRLRHLAIERGLMNPEELAKARAEDLMQLIFLPSFSTRREVSRLSGRGVGLDAVRAAVERIGGRVAVESESGMGTRFVLVLPFSLMVTSIVKVECNGQEFGVPLDAVVETVLVPEDRIQTVGRVSVFAYRDRAAPLLDLGKLLDRPTARARTGSRLAMIVSVGGQIGAVEIDRIGERLDVILRAPDGIIAGSPGIAGVTLLGDGQVLVVLDLQQLLD